MEFLFSGIFYTDDPPNRANSAGIPPTHTPTGSEGRIFPSPILPFPPSQKYIISFFPSLPLPLFPFRSLDSLRDITFIRLRGICSNSSCVASQHWSSYSLFDKSSANPSFHLFYFNYSTDSVRRIIFYLGWL